MPDAQKTLGALGYCSFVVLRWHGVVTGVQSPFKAISPTGRPGRLLDQSSGDPGVGKVQALARPPLSDYSAEITWAPPRPSQHCAAMAQWSLGELAQPIPKSSHQARRRNVILCCATW